MTPDGHMWGWRKTTVNHMQSKHFASWIISYIISDIGNIYFNSLLYLIAFLKYDLDNQLLNLTISSLLVGKKNIVSCAKPYIFKKEDLVIWEG